MEIHKLNDLQIKSAEKGKKEYRLSDGGGLYLVVPVIQKHYLSDRLWRERRLPQWTTNYEL